MELYTVKVDNADEVARLEKGDPFSLPSGLALWQPANGARVVVNNREPTVLESYASWQLAHWAGEVIPSGTDALADFDGDGCNNLAEFAYGLDPKVPDAGKKIFPVISATGTEATFAYRRRALTVLNDRYEFSSDLVTWQPLVEEHDYSVTIIPEGSDERVTVELVGAKEKGPGFVRIVTGIGSGAVAGDPEAKK
jgi:hypothetical protein